MRSRHGRKNAGLRFNLSGSSQTGAPWIPLFALFALTLVFCAAVLFALDRKPSRRPAEGSVQATRFSVESNDGVGQSWPGYKVEQPMAGGVVEKFAGRFEKCERRRYTCVVDGDTFWLKGEKIRIADIDTPEISQPRCREEFQLGLVATGRLIELLNQGEFQLTSTGRRDVDRYGRKLRMLTRGNSSIGEQLVREGLAHRWDGRKLSWCER